MQNRSMWVLRLIGAATLSALIYGGFCWGSEVLTSLNVKGKDNPKPQDVVKAETAPHPQRLALNSQISKCHSNEPTYHACMFEAGYAINPAWIVAHDSDAKNGSERAIDVVRDPFRADVSPAYGIPYWVPKQDKNARS